jgi:hypothetical protein
MNCIITQAKDQSFRLKDWILYHYEEGFDTFIYFDDYSEDNSISVINDISKKYDINIIVNYSDGIGNKKSITEMMDSNSYGGDTSINYRLIRSYNSGLKIAREIDPNSICAIIDVDEFLVSNYHKSLDAIKILMNERMVGQLYINSFDINDDFDVSMAWYSTNENTKFRWDYDFRKNTYFKTRGKSVCISSYINEIPQEPGYVHVLKKFDEKYFFDNIDVNDYDFLRMHHYRKPCMDRSFKFVEDRTILDKMIKIKEKYDK